MDISLFRPGPAQLRHGHAVPGHPDGRRTASYPHEDLAPPRWPRPAGAGPIFHEQVLRIIHAMTGCGLSAAERVRRQLTEEQTREQAGEWFRGLARDRGYDAVTTARSGRCRGVRRVRLLQGTRGRVRIPTYQSAWLKRHYPAAFYAGVLTHDPGMYPKRVIVADARLAACPSCRWT